MISARVSRRDVRRFEKAVNAIAARYGQAAGSAAVFQALTNASKPLQYGIRARTPTGERGKLKSTVKARRARLRKGKPFRILVGYHGGGRKVRVSQRSGVEYGSKRNRKPAMPLRKASERNWPATARRFARWWQRDVDQVARKYARARA